MVLLRRAPKEPGLDTPADRGRLLAIGSLVLVAALVLISAGVFLGRASVHTAAPTRPAPTPSALASTSPSVPAHSKAGAAQAAYTIARTLGSPQDLDKGWRTKLLDRIAAPAARAQLARQWDLGARYVEAGTRLVTAQHAGSPVIGLDQPIAWQAAAYSPATARIAVWSVGVLGGTAGYPPTASWGTTTYTLSWASGRWLLSGVHSAAGPVPVADKTTNPTAADDLITAYRGMTRYSR